MPRSLKDLSPLRVIIGSEDVTGYLTDSGFNFSNVDPGGFESLSANFPRDLPQTLRGDHIRVDSGLHVAWEGRVSQIQRSLGHNTVLTGEGYGAVLKDYGASMVFVDRDLTRWVQPSYPRQQALVAANNQPGTSQVAADPTTFTPALVQSITDSWTSPFAPLCEAWYDAGPNNLISAIVGSLSGAGVIGAGGFWEQFVLLASDAVATINESSGNVNAGGAITFAPATAYRFAFLAHLYGASPAGQQGAIYNVYWTDLAVYGNHGLPLRGPTPAGLYPSDIVGWIAANEPQLQAGTIQETDSSGYIIPHYVQYLPVVFDTIINDMSQIQGWHWGVWPSPSPLTGDPRPRLDFMPRPAPGAFTAFCRRQDCDTLDIREDLSQQYNVATVNYSDVAGVPGSVTVTMDNPILDEAGIGNRTLVISAGTMTPATAALYGLEALALTNIQQRVAGAADIIAPIDTGVGHSPAWLLRAGEDRLRIADVPSSDAFGSMSDFPISRVEASMSSGGMTTSVELGSGANLVETLNARVAASTALAAQGG